LARKFLAQDGFYPDWAKGEGRWAIQRVFTTVRGMMAQTDSLTRPAVSHESLIWVPKRVGISAIFTRRENQAIRATAELSRIPIVCGGCDWTGSHPAIESQGRGPEHWTLRCPACGSIVGPDVDSLDSLKILARWDAVSRPVLDQPGAATSIKSIRPIADLRQWIRSYEPMENELAYVGQQMYANFADFILACSSSR
jgi:hypothetical protein